ncbi:coiled-coil domain-containing protein 187 isoform X6 [Entelurus aequoreus]|uniref:coiled-coil domain-containing protein 187 isoform X6 n=1 Tax=Entelurus aequoreus TaxID=161455 RepID=UPI002B1DB396|nr:coiled-coil domain-containing protein 187 isoform X6 [Entelurus aequoreus]
MMAELQIDQSSLPRVQEVRQSFAVLEDGVLAHNLQEQEIEQYYTTNIQKNQLVQNDIRVAKQLQDEEKEQQAQQRALLRQTSRRLEEQDFEYARVIQEEIQQTSEAAWRREQDDEEMARRMQEEEEQRMRRTREQEEYCEVASLKPKKEQTSLDMGELRQVLQDEEVARKMQEEESKLFLRTSQSTPCRCHPQGDFRVAQVAQDEEIAHYMQKQEVKSHRRSRDLEGPASWREHRAMMSLHDRRSARERQVQRERLDSEGFPSPTEDCPPENQPPSPVSTLPQPQQQRNIAEELDPTFQTRRQGADILQMGQSVGPISQSLPAPHAGLQDFPQEPNFIPPTKRPTDKQGRTKPKEKKENFLVTEGAEVVAAEEAIFAPTLCVACGGAHLHQNLCTCMMMMMRRLKRVREA